MAVAKRPYPLNFEVAAGVMVTSTGWIDCILYTLTRKNLFFGDREGELGLFRLRSDLRSRERS